MRKQRLIEVNTICWTQPLLGWEPLEFEIRNFTEARAVLKRIMAL